MFIYFYVYIYIYVYMYIVCVYTDGLASEGKFWFCKHMASKVQRYLAHKKTPNPLGPP